MKTSRLMRAALPLLAVVGFASFNSDVHADTFAGKHIFNYVEMTTDLTPGFMRDSFRIEGVSDAPIFASDGFSNPPAIFDERVHTKRRMSHIRSVTHFQVYEGPLVHSFMELASGIAVSTSERTDYTNTLNTDQYVQRFAALPPAKHAFQPKGTARTGHRKAFDNYDGHIIVGYDLSKTTPGNKSATFEPFAGYFWIHSRTSRQSVDGCFLSNEPAAVTLVPARAHTESLLFWHGFLLGGKTEVRWYNNTIGLRGQAHFCRARSHQLTREMTGNINGTNFPIMEVIKMKFARDKEISTWRYLGYSASIIFKRHIPLTGWTIFSETKYTHMRDKRYSDRAFKVDVNNTIVAKNRIEKLWHRRFEEHAGVSYSY